MILRHPLMLASLVSATGCGACGRSTAPEAALGSPPLAAAPSTPDGPPAQLPADRPGRPQHGRGIFGVNEGVGIPTAFLDSGRVTLAQEPAVLAGDVAALQDLGVGAVRNHTATYPFLSWQRTTRRDGDLRRADTWVAAVQAGGVDPLMMIGPWPGNATANFTSQYVPENLDAYTTWVQSVVERYDGDGVDDMPGLLRPVHFWEVDNEPDLHNSVPPKGSKGKASVDPADFETPAQYAQVLVATSAAIKRADPQAVVLSAGFYRPHTDSGRRYIDAFLAQPGVRDSFDVLSLHCYFHEDELGKITRTLETWRATTPDKPLWITETGVPSVDNSPWIDETWQGRMVAATYGAFLAGGADRIFWHTLQDPPTGRQPRNNGFSTHSLRGQDSDGVAHDKPAGLVYRRLSQHLADVDPRTIEEIPAVGGRLLRAGSGWLAFWAAPVPPAGVTEYQDLLTGEMHPVGASVPSPAWMTMPATTTPDASAQPAG